MARVVRFHEIGDAAVLRIEDLDVPPPAPGHIRIRVSAIGVNRADATFRAGNHLVLPKLPSGLGYEAAGTVESVGDGVSGFDLGDIVSAIPQMEPDLYNTYGEFASIPASFAVKHPSVLSMVEAAALWSSYLTAYGALVEVAHVSDGDFVVITAASSSVGQASVQIANMLHATPIATTRGRQKVQALLAAGAGEVIVTEEEDVHDRIMSITRGNGARVVFDPVGGPGVNALANAMSPNGILLEYGLLSGKVTPFPLFASITKRLTMAGYRIDNLDAGRLARGKRFIIGGVERGVIRPLIAKTFPLGEIVQAHRFLESNLQVGKIVVTTDA